LITTDRDKTRNENVMGKRVKNLGMDSKRKEEELEDK
jgi:hypothetical protein